MPLHPPEARVHGCATERSSLRLHPPVTSRCERRSIAYASMERDRGQGHQSVRPVVGLRAGRATACKRLVLPPALRLNEPSAAGVEPSVSVQARST